MGNGSKDSGNLSLYDRRDGGITQTVWTLSGLILAACGGGGGGGGIAVTGGSIVRNPDIPDLVIPDRSVARLDIITTDTRVVEGGTTTTRDPNAHGRITVEGSDPVDHVIQARGTSSSFTDGSYTANSNKGADIDGTYGTLYLKADFTFTYELYDETTTQGAALQALTGASSNIFDVFAVRVDSNDETQTTVRIHVIGSNDDGDGGSEGEGEGEGEDTSFTIPGNLVSTRSTPLYPNSVVSNDHDFIHTDDPSDFSSLTYIGTRDNVEMPDKRKGPQDPLRDDGVYIFEARYSDGTAVGMWAHPDFGSREAAQMSAEPVAEAVGKLPTFMRSTLRHVVIQEGDETAYAEHIGHFFTIYSDNIQTRISNHDLEETVFHESVHATLDYKYRSHNEWQKAQRADGGYITEYAASRITEDLAESALFAWAMLMHPGRLPEMVEQQARAIMPNRLAFFEEMFKFEGLTLPQPTAGAAGKEAANTAPVGAIDNIDGHDAAETGFQLAADII